MPWLQWLWIGLAAAAAVPTECQGPLTETATGAFRPNIVYIKIPKTAGSTVAGIVRRISARHGLAVYAPPPGVFDVTRREATAFVEAARKEATARVAFCNHGKYEPWMSDLAGPSASLWTVVRDPADRVLSHRHFFSGQDSEPNVQHEHVRLALPSGNSSSRTWDAFAWVGVTDRLDESLVVLQMTLNLSLADVLHVSAKVAIGRPPASSYPADELQSLRDREWKDRDLYRAAVQRLDADIASLRAKSFGVRLRCYRQAQALVQAKCRGDAAARRDCYWNDNGCAQACVDQVYRDLTQPKHVSGPRAQETAPRGR